MHHPIVHEGKQQTNVARIVPRPQYQQHVFSGLDLTVGDVDKGDKLDGDSGPS